MSMRTIRSEKFVGVALVAVAAVGVLAFAPFGVAQDEAKAPKKGTPYLVQPVDGAVEVGGIADDTIPVTDVIRLHQALMEFDKNRDEYRKDQENQIAAAIERGELELAAHLRSRLDLRELQVTQQSGRILAMIAAARQNEMIESLRKEVSALREEVKELRAKMGE